MSENFFDLTNAANEFTVGAEISLGTSIRTLAGSDRVIGSDNTDLVFGNDGADYLYGGAGADQFWGGRGADLLWGNEGTDQLWGERGNDVLFGGRDSDLLMGQEGDDFLAGDAGVDTMTGGDGSDAFVLDSRHGTTDRNFADLITDFSNDEGDVFALTDGANDALTEADLSLETVGTDTFISLKATGLILARVQGMSAEDLTDTFSTVRQTLDDTEPGATGLSLIPGSATVQGFVGEDDYVDFFQFQVTETSIIDFSLSGLSADVDLVLYTDLDDDGELGGDDETLALAQRLGNANETIQNVTLDPGRYFLKVEQFEGDTNYNLSISGVAGTVAKDLAGSQPSTARLLPPTAEVSLHDYIGGDDAVDTYRLEILNSGYLDLLAGDVDENVNVTLWSDLNSNNQLDAGETIAQGTKIAEGTNEILLDVINPGTYYVNVTAAGVPTPYAIAAISEPGSRVGVESYSPLFPGLPTTGTLSHTDAVDPEDPENYADPYLLTELGAGLTVTVTQESEAFDAYLRVVDLLTGEVVAENDDIDTEGDNFNAQVSFTTEQGAQYVVYASSVDSPGIGDYILNTTVTGTVTQSIVSSASSGDQLTGANESLSSSQLLTPPKVTVNFPNGKKEFNLIYQPLTGGRTDSFPIRAMNQGRFGDCFFLAALTATFGKIEDPSAANAATSAVINNAINGTENYTIKFYNAQGGSMPITVDNQVVTYPKKLFENGTTSADGAIYGAAWEKGAKLNDASGRAIWASIFESAFAKYRGGYGNINGGFPGYALALITGKGIDYVKLQSSASSPETGKIYPLAEVTAFSSQSGFSYSGSPTNLSADQLFETIQTALNEGRYVAAGTPGGNDQKSLYGGVIQEGHAYSVHNAYVDANGQKMILVRNPWGVDNNSNAKAAEDPSTDIKDGFIAITFDAFLKYFDSLSLTKG